MKIVLLPLSLDGCHWYRAFQPYEEIKRQGLAEVVMATDEDIKYRPGEVEKHIVNADYVVGRFCHREYIRWMDKYHPGKKVIIDNDDYVFNPDPYGDIYGLYGLKEVRHGGDWLWKEGQAGFNIVANLERRKEDMALMARADILTVSTQRLADEYKHKNCKVVYNALNLDTWKPYPGVLNNREDSSFRIGWSGGSTHYSDLYTIKDDLKDLMKKYPRIKLVITGVHFPGIFKDFPQDRIETQGWIDITGHPYRSILNGLDLAFIPLAKNHFNKFKSCIKWYEFASIGVPTIAQNYPPYSDEMPKIALYDNFKKTVEEYYNSRTLRADNAREGLKWVEQNRDIKVIAKDLYNFLNES